MGLFLIKKQDGMGLIAAVMAAALVVVAALAITYFITDQNKQVVVLENSTQCQQVLKTVMDYIDKDNNSLFITSFGPEIPAGSPPGTASTFPPGRDITIDGIDRFNFVQGGAPIQSLYGPNSTIRFDPDGTTVGTPLAQQLAERNQQFNGVTTQIPAAYKFTNSLNIKNTINRIIALSYQRNICMNNLDSMLANDGTNAPVAGSVIYSPGSAANVPGLLLNEDNVRVIIGTNFSTNAAASFCPDTATASDIPTAGDRATAKVRVQVFTNISSVNRADYRVCMGETTTYFADDNVPPLTIMSNISGLLNTGNVQYSCNPLGTELFFDVRSVIDRNPATRTCETCLQTLPTAFGTDPIAICNPANNASACVESDPGTIFLCRIGEKHWFDMNKDHWEPCDQTAVYGCVGGNYDVEEPTAVATNTCIGRRNLGTVRIVYDDNGAVNPTLTSRGTRARVFLAGLEDQRAYEVDVRAVDTRGVLVGKSFTGTVGIMGTTYLFGPTFVTTRDAPTVVNVVKNSPLVGPAGQMLGAVGVSDYSVYSQFTNEYQCQAGNVDVVGTVSYPTMPAYVYDLIRTETCTVSATGGAPVVSTVAGGACNCVNGICTGTVPIAVGGNWTATMGVSNICGAVGVPGTTTPWCYEDTVTSPLASVTVTNQTTANPNLAQTANGTKKCPVSAGVGNFAIPANVTYPIVNPGATRSTAFTAMGWSLPVNSGCIAEFTGPQACSKMTDVCGHQATAGANYQSYLAENQPTPTTNTCLRVGNPSPGTQVNGNQCIAGTYCGSAYKCLTRTPVPGPGSNIGQPCYSNSTGVSVPTNIAAAPCTHVTDCGFGKATHIPGVCSGADYRCVATSDSTIRPLGICSSVGGACNVVNTCNGTSMACHTNAGVLIPGASCAAAQCHYPGNIFPNVAGTDQCLQVDNSGTCQYGGNPCDTNPGDGVECLDYPGNCELQPGGEGVCLAPTNAGCFDCPNSGDLVTCPRVNGGCDIVLPPVAPTGNLSCASGPPVCTPGACVPGPEINRTDCIDAGGAVADVGEAGTRTITYGPCSNGCAACVCATTQVVACVGDNLQVFAGCFVDTHPDFDMTQNPAYTEQECTTTDAMVCSVGNRLNSAGPGPGDSYIFDNPGDYTVVWSGPAWCTSNVVGSRCISPPDQSNGNYNVGMVVTHTPTGRVWNLSVGIHKQVRRIGLGDTCPPLP